MPTFINVKIPGFNRTSIWSITVALTTMKSIAVVMYYCSSLQCGCKAQIALKLPLGFCTCTVDSIMVSFALAYLLPRIENRDADANRQ